MTQLLFIIAILLLFTIYLLVKKEQYKEVYDDNNKFKGYDTELCDGMCNPKNCKGIPGKKGSPLLYRCQWW